MFSLLRTAETKNDDGTPLSSLFEHVLWKIRHPKDPFLHPKQSHQFDTLWHQTQDGYLAPIFSVSPKSPPVGSIMVLCGPYTHPLVYLLNKCGFLHQLLNSGLRVHLVSHRGHNLGTGKVRSSFENVIHYDIPSALDAIHRFDHDLPLFLLGVDLGSILAMGWLSICGTEDFCGAAIINTPVTPPKGPVPNILQQLPSWICPPIEQLGFIAANLDLELSLSTLSPSLRRRILHERLIG
jgi:alpha-beta hydrolase superfamily lysophospholipase